MVDEKNLIKKPTEGEITASSSKIIRSCFTLDNKIVYSELPIKELQIIINNWTSESDKRNEILGIKEKNLKREINLTKQEIENYVEELKKKEKNIRELQGQLRVVKVENFENQSEAEINLQITKISQLIENNTEKNLSKSYSKLATWVNSDKQENTGDIERMGGMAQNAGFGDAVGAGAATGTATGTVGALIGTAFFPGVGTVIGAAIGGLVGGVGMGSAVAVDNRNRLERATKKELREIISKNEKKEGNVKNELIRFTELTRKKTNRLENELLESKKVLMRVKEVMADKERETQVKISELEKKNEEIKKNLTQVNIRAERIQKEIAEANKKAELEVNKMKSLQSKERVELEQLKEKYNKVNKTAEEREEELKAYKEIAEEFKGDKDIILLEYNILLGKWKILLIEEGKLNTVIGELNGTKRVLDKKIEALENNYNEVKGERDHWHQEKNKLESEKLAKTQEIEKLETEKIFLENQKKQLENKRIQLEANIKDLNEQIKQLNKTIKEKDKEILSQKRKKNWALFASTVQGFTTSILGDKWGKRANTVIQVGTGATLLRNAGEWTYEVWLMGIGVGLVFVVPRLYNIGAHFLEKWTGVKLPRWNAKDKVSAKLDQLNEKAKEKAREVINVVVNTNQPPQATDTKENQETAKNFSAINNETTKTEPKSKKNGSTEKKKNKKKVKGESD